jgi:hypothetical protein
MSEFARIGIVTTLFVALLSIGSAVGISFYFKTLPQPASLRPDPVVTHSLSSPVISHMSPNLARSDKTDSVFDIRQRRGQDGRVQSSEKPLTPLPSSTPDRDPRPIVAEPNFDAPATTEDGPPSQPGSIAVSAEPEPEAAASEPDFTAPARPAREQRTRVPPAAAGLGAATPSKAVRRPAPCRSDACRQALAECSKLCDSAMTLSVAACPRVSSGASEKDEKACLAKWDRRRRDCHSGCALRQARASKTP